MAIAERLYLQDPKLANFRAKVSDIREFARKDGVQVWQVALDRTAFYPTGGGQPHDLGMLKATSRSGAELLVPVEDVQEDEAGEVWHTTGKPLLAGTPVECTLDEERRRDHTQQHSGQHLLSALLATKFGLRTVSFHLGQQDTTIDLEAEPGDARAPLADRLDAVLTEAEEDVNRAIARNLAVSVRVVSREQAQALLAAGSLRKLPARAGDMRLVEIPGIDLNACGGTHVAALGEIGSVLLRGTERVKNGLRLHFVCGLRAVRAARGDWRELGNASALLSVGRAEVTAALARLQGEARALAKERLRLREEIASSHAVQLAVEEPFQGGLRLVSRRFAERDPEYLKLLATRLLQAVPHTAAVLAATGSEPATVLIASNLAAGAGRTSRACDVLLRGVLAPYGLRGGGTAELAQAEVPAALLGDVIASLERELAGP